MEILDGDSDLLDRDNCRTESATRVAFINPSFKLAVKKMQDVKLVHDRLVWF